MSKLLSSQVRITFLGGAGTVTGSKTLIEFGDHTILVDCGLFQGLKELRNLNRCPFPVLPKKIDAIILTHAHLDHCGYLPVLVREGFKGPIYCTEPTRDLAEIILKDSAKIQEEDANRANRYNYSKHDPAKPLYSISDVFDTIGLFSAHDFNEWVIINNDIKFEFLPNGHILGSAFTKIIIDEKTFLFSGDIGQSKPMLLYPPKKIKEADYIVMESTYGDRIHPEIDTKTELLKIIDATYARKGILMIPSFAVERTQEILYLIYQLRKEGLLPNIPVYLDSPMGVNATKVYDRYHELQNISNYEINRMYDDVHFIDDPVLSKKICLDKNPKILLAGSGMIEGGRILHYLNNHADNPKNTLLFVGFQSEGTRGRAILNGSREIKFFGEYHPVKCVVESLSNLSAHGDQEDILNWLRNFKKAPQKLFLNHGEKHQTEALCVKVKHELNWEVSVPNRNDAYIVPSR